MRFSCRFFRMKEENQSDIFTQPKVYDAKTKSLMRQNGLFTICDVPRGKGTNAENIANLFLVSIDSFGVALSSKKIRKIFKHYLYL